MGIIDSEKQASPEKTIGFKPLDCNEFKRAFSLFPILLKLKSVLKKSNLKMFESVFSDAKFRYTYESQTVFFSYPIIPRTLYFIPLYE